MVIGIQSICSYIDFTSSNLSSFLINSNNLAIGSLGFSMHTNVSTILLLIFTSLFLLGHPEKYETELGQGGVNVSGGQKQRLCIARALLKKPKILILDDSTSAVDTATESKIRESFYTTLKETTKIIIAQRITSVMEADQIIVLDEGKVVGIGKHAELLEGCNTYNEIYYSQNDKEDAV